MLIFISFYSETVEEHFYERKENNNSINCITFYSLDSGNYLFFSAEKILRYRAVNLSLSVERISILFRANVQGIGCGGQSSQPHKISIWLIPFDRLSFLSPRQNRSEGKEGENGGFGDKSYTV